MNLELIEDEQCLRGACRVTLCTPKKFEHICRHVSVSDNAANDDIYDSNIQIADMNALNGALAVHKWKKFCLFYQDLFMEHQSAYVTNTHQLTRDEQLENDAENNTGEDDEEVA